MKNKRLIEVAFPIKQTSLASVHEKNIRHGHISTLHIWPARRPLAASRAALIAALLPVPHNSNEIGLLLERISGKSIETIGQRHVNGHTVEQTKEEAVGGVLRWGQENSLDVQRFQEEIRKIHAGRAPKVLDPFAGGGAIPLEAMRLGCEVTALDINPVAWFILKCTLEYPQKLAGQTCSLPEFVLKDHDFMAVFLKAKGLKGTNLQAFLKKFTQGDKGEIQLNLMSRDDPMLEADLAWHVRAWGRWILAKVRSKLASYYPTYAAFEPLKTGKDFEPRSIRLLKEDQEGIPQIDFLNAEFNENYIKNPLNPRWVVKPTVAYLWARAVQCKQCRATLPLLKTCWLCKKDRKRVRLTLAPASKHKSIVFGIQVDVPQVDGSSGQRREYDRRIGVGTMSRTGATCPLCQAIMTMEDVRIEGRAGRLTEIMTAVVVNGLNGKEYRLPTDHEIAIAQITEEQIQECYRQIPFGLLNEPTPKAGSGAARAFSVDGYGLNTWRKLFTNRQLLTLGTFTQAIRQLLQNPFNLTQSFNEAVIAYLALANDRLADYSSAICSWHNSGEKLGHTFTRFALPIVWDFAEVNPFSDSSGNYLGAVEWVSRAISHICSAAETSPSAKVLRQSALVPLDEQIDLVITDPPYYDAIPYSDAMDFFHVWLRRATHGLSPEIDAAFREPLSPKWDHDAGDGELIDDASRFGGDKVRSKKNYEDGMARAFQACHKVLQPDGRLVVVFANKQPDAWETLVSALIRAGFVVTASCEMTTRTRAMASAALSSSIWLVCRKRSNTRLGWDNRVLQDMRENIIQQLRDFWDAGIRGPDFVWSATGPALEAFSAYPVVKKANAPNQFMDVVEFLREVRRIVVDFVVGRVLSRDGHEVVSGLDDVTTYYLLHRHDYRMAAAPVGSCILYALSCNLSNTALVNQYDLLTQSGKFSTGSTAEDNATETATSNSSGTTVRLKTWSQRKGRKLGLEVSAGQPIPLIDQVHRLMHLWRAGDQIKVNEYLDLRGLQQNGLFPPLLQALIELADAGSNERSLLEALSNHIAARGDIRAPSQQQLL